jgi:hypothetical protein
MSLRRLAGYTVAFFLVAAAGAAPAEYVISGFNFDDGGTAYGTFAYDPVTNLYSNVNITTTAGTVLPGAIYQFVCGQDVPSCTGLGPSGTNVLTLTSTASNQMGLPAFVLEFPALQPLGSAQTIPIVFGLEASCADPPCSAPVPPERLLAEPTNAAVVVINAPFEITSAANLSYADVALNITNTGASSTALNPVTQEPNGNLCANVYVFSPEEELISCCACYVTPDALSALSLNNDILNNTLTPERPTSLVIKLLATFAGTAGGSGPGTASAPTCNPATVLGAGFMFQQGNSITNGLAAWRVSSHALGPSAVLSAGGTIPPAGTTLALTEVPFTIALNNPATPAELTRITALCGFIQGNGSNYGICNACRLGGL